MKRGINIRSDINISISYPLARRSKNIGIIYGSLVVIAVEGDIQHPGAGFQLLVIEVQENVLWWNPRHV